MKLHIVFNKIFYSFVISSLNNKAVSKYSNSNNFIKFNLIV